MYYKCNSLNSQVLVSEGGTILYCVLEFMTSFSGMGFQSNAFFPGTQETLAKQVTKIAVTQRKNGKSYLKLKVIRYSN